MIRQLDGVIHSTQAAALLLGAASLLSRILGVLRDRMLAGQFGASRELDIYYAAFQLPDILFTILLVGAASAAIIPILVDLASRDPAGARRFVTELIRVFAVIAIGVLVLAFLATPTVVGWVTPGFSAEEHRTTVTMSRIMLASPLLLGLSGILSSVLQSFRRFLLFSLAAVFYNLGIIAGIAWFVPRWGLTGLAGGVVLGALLHVAIQLPAFRELGFRFSARPRNEHQPLLPETRMVYYLSIPRVVALSIHTLTTVILVAVASTLAVGSITVFQFASNLHFLPIGIIGVSFALAVFPSLSAEVARGDGNGFRTSARRTTRSILFWILPCALLAYVLRAQIVRVALGAGEFGWTDTRLTAALLGLLAFAIIAESLTPLVVRSFYALGNTRTPFYAGLASAILTLGSTVGAMRFLASGGVSAAVLSEILRIPDLTDLRVIGIGIGILIGSWTHYLLLATLLRRAMDRRWTATVRFSLRAEVEKLILAALVGSAVSFGMLRVVTQFVELETFAAVLLQGSVAALAGLASYAGVLTLLRSEELRSVRAILRARFRMTEVLAPTEVPSEHHT